MELSLEELQWIETALTWSATDNGPVPTGWSKLTTRVRDQLSLAKAQESKQSLTWAPDIEDLSLAIFKVMEAKAGWIGNTLEHMADLAAKIAWFEIDGQMQKDGLVRVLADDLDRQICMTPVSALVTQADHDVEQRLCNALAKVKPVAKRE